MRSSIEATVQAWHAAGLFDGAVLVAHEGELVWQGGAGFADRAWRIPNAADVVYPIASLTKQFTAVLTLQLIEEGRFTLETTISELLPWFPAESAQRLRIRDLLTHRAGLTEPPAQAYYDPLPTTATAREFVEAHATGPLSFEPGAQFQYGNSEYHVLEAILVEVTGKSFEVLLEERITKPLAMTSTRIARRTEITPRRAHDYVPRTDRPGKWENPRPYQWENWGGAGGLESTVTDLHRWNRALRRNELLSPVMTETMLTPGDNYVALGSWVYPRSIPGTDDQPTLVERRGAIGGFTILNVWEKDADTWVILLGNTYNESIHTLPYASCLPLDLLAIVHGGEPQGPPGE